MFKEERIPGLVSVIIPTYNRTKVLREAVDSVLTQTYTQFEIIIIDDRSNEAISRFVFSLKDLDPRIKIFTRQGNINGPSICRNEGVKASKGEFLLFLDSDDLLEKFCL